MKSKFVLCLALVLNGGLARCSTDWPQKAATVHTGMTRAQATSILPMWDNREHFVATLGSSTIESYWVAKDWMAVVSYTTIGGAGSLSNLIIAPVSVNKVTYSQVFNLPLALLVAFKNCQVFWQQSDIAEKIVALHDTNVLQNPSLTACLTNEDRRARGNAAFIFAGLGDERGFDVLCKILTDRSARSEGQGVPGGNWTLPAQIAADRYYAVFLFGNLKDTQAVPILIPLLKDTEVNYAVPRALGSIGDKRAIQPLIETLSDKAPSMRVLAIYALDELKAREALPRLHELLNDDDRSNFGDLVSVAEAAREAITELKPNPDAVDRLVVELSSSCGIWHNGFPVPFVDLPQSATIPKVIARVFQQTDFDGGRVKHYRILESREVQIQHVRSGASDYTVVLLKTDWGRKIVMMRYSTDLKGWWRRVYNADGPFDRYY